MRVKHTARSRYQEAIRIGRHLRRLRRDRDRSQEELAELLGVSVGWVSRIERGTDLPNLLFLVHFGHVLRVPVDELLPRERMRSVKKWQR
jgi:transcriptional regulator with XRE-family HTH domain